jgi:hypothetical protein
MICLYLDSGVKSMSKVLITVLVFLSAGVNAAPGLLDLDYSFDRPLKVESRVVNTVRFDIIQSDDKWANLNGYAYMAEIFEDNLLIVRCTGTDAVQAFSTEGDFSFSVHDQRRERGIVDQYVVIREWGGGKVVSYFIFDTNTSECGTTTMFTTTADLYEVTSDASLILSMPADIEGLENCPLSDHPFDTVKLSFGISGVTQNIIKKAEKPLRC